jgi:hypothetical protein
MNAEPKIRHDRAEFFEHGFGLTGLFRRAEQRLRVHRSHLLAAHVDGAFLGLCFGVCHARIDHVFVGWAVPTELV